VADADGGLRVIDVSNPQSPNEAGYYITSGFAWGVAAAGSYAYVAANDSGLRIIEFYGAGVEEPRPTPDAPRITPGATIVRGVLWLGGAGQSQCVGRTGLRDSPCAALLDIGGRKVLDLRPGPNDISSLAPGVYFAREEYSSVRRFVVTR